ncbi:uncharacterized mitochondrial protein-like protein [Tanacetum coccineum]
MNQFCGIKGIKREFSVARTPQQNGVAERKNRTLIEAARTMLNRVLVTKPHNKTPYELLLGRPPSIGFMRPFGCLVTILNILDPLGKFDRKADEGFLVGYSVNSKAFRVFNTRTRKVEENLHINFLENKPNVIGSGLEWLFNIDSLTKSINYELVTTGSQTNANAAQLIRILPGKEDDDVNDGVNKENGSNNQERTDNTRIFDSAYDDEDVGAEADLNNLETTMNASPIPTTRIHKDHPKEQIIGGINSATQTRRMTKMFEENVMMEPKKVTQALDDERPLVLSGSLETKRTREGLLLETKPDDIIFGFTKKSLSTEFEQLMHKRFQMSSTGELTFFLGQQVEQRKDGIFISQDKDVCDNLKKFDFSSVKTTSTPMETHKPLLKDADGTDVDVHLYRCMIGSLMYLTSSRPDIMFAVCACSRFQVQPKASYMHAVKRIFRYLKGQPTLGLWYTKDSPFDLIAYSDSDYAGASIDRKSTIGGCQFLGYWLISWQYKKQTVVANSTTKAEYIAASNCYGRVLWLQNQLLDYGYNFM